MTKEEFIEVLKSYKENKAKLQLREKEKEKYEKMYLKNRHPELEKGITSVVGINNDIKSKNKTSDKVADAIIHAEEKQEEALKKIDELNKEIDRLKNLVEEAEIRLNSLYYKEKEIVYAYYVDNRTAEDISQNLYFKLFSRTCSIRYIRKLINNCLEKMIKL